MLCDLSSYVFNFFRPVACHFQLSRYPVLLSLEQRTQVPKAYAFIGAVTLFTLLHFVNALAAPASNLIGWGLPAYLSFKALESPGHDDDAQWLTYWIIFGFFNFAEGFALRALLYYFPWYFSFKTLFILWLQLPAFRVSTVNLSSHEVSGRLK
jgi:receptor expression-enhancing protein 5/6